MRRERYMEEEKNERTEKMTEIDLETEVPVPLSIACLLSYFVPVIGGVFFLFAENRNRLIRFHAVQSILFSVFFGICIALASIIGSSFLNRTVGIIFILYWAYAMHEALKCRLRRLPVIGDIAFREIYGE
jgi:uncharacterized membrane protein